MLRIKGAIILVKKWFLFQKKHGNSKMRYAHSLGSITRPGSLGIISALS
nr:hypothetical protein [uncultured Allomuricauda sp.]